MHSDEKDFQIPVSKPAVIKTEKLLRVDDALKMIKEYSRYVTVVNSFLETDRDGGMYFLCTDFCSDQFSFRIKFFTDEIRFFPRIDHPSMEELFEQFQKIVEKILSERYANG